VEELAAEARQAGDRRLALAAKVERRRLLEFLSGLSGLLNKAQQTTNNTQINVVLTEDKINEQLPGILEREVQLRVELELQRREEAAGVEPRLLPEEAGN
jgi:hypothetical protein